MRFLGEKEKIRFNNYGGLWVNEKAFFAGIGAVLLSFLTGYNLSQNIEVVTVSPTSLLAASVFAGLALGNYTGVSTEKKGRTSYSFLLGASLTAAVALPVIIQDIVLAAIVGIAASTVVLFHESGMGLQNPWLDRMVDIVAGKLSILGLISLGLYYYVLPMVYSLYINVIHGYAILGPI